jgi:hypothetical protein
MGLLVLVFFMARSTTSNKKWDGVLIKVDDLIVTTCLIELAGGIQCNSTSTKEKSDTTKLYKN